MDEVVSSSGHGVYKVEILEGPTDNPLRLSAYDEYYTFGIEGTGWNILCEILRKESAVIEAYLDRFFFLVRRFPDHFELLDHGRRQA